ncbi:MAG TPA: hypothetical protein VMU57_01620 [Edaphobacter sp.]|uniref:hypothetical protein n=1 Tax=Edaphobacter sp. TaxID=1934404 RepID=UPI002C52E01D|nr:hypothetical protein [Edaphobacter sp.]HUZ93591.1 hypothetical protein [Edaphobacter sp.]
MRCAGHLDGTGTAACGGCGSPGCEACFEQVGGAFYCTDCLLKRLQKVETETTEADLATETRNLREEAKRRIRRNWILTAAFSVLGVPAMIGLFAGDPSVPPAVKAFAVPISGIAAVYLIWASLWGIPAAWRWWKGLFENSSALVFTSGLGWIILAVSFFIIPLEFGYAYGVFGGAIYEYRKTKRIAGEESLPQTI